MGKYVLGYLVAAAGGCLFRSGSASSMDSPVIVEFECILCSESPYCGMSLAHCAVPCGWTFVNIGVIRSSRRNRMLVVYIV